MHHALSGGSLNSLNEPELAALRIRDEPPVHFEANSDQAHGCEMVPARSVISQGAVARPSAAELELV